MKLSWCKFEVIVESPKDVQISYSSGKTLEIPSMFVTTIQIVSASVIYCQGEDVNYELLSVLLILFACFF